MLFLWVLTKRLPMNAWNKALYLENFSFII
jgi:hypothetical protein